ncbi:Nif11-like leader peptide family natural product precursor [Leptolyngbya sp. FACHB-321]|uniref:Nif11 family protein n=1 Tax=Leptolyngbya sp. FACHB-321 TaxID=2692807 RepID=UPI00168546B1|nr:Nif11 family protein [Leptolyngbya sp. FACHB-321]MBD2033940.1 Nif11-like leader peptide family natural product precursor [Leptolyngbya sp. FACHB-321]
MAKTLEQFNQVILRDSTIQEQLKVSTDQVGFAKLMVELGAEKGYSFTTADVEEQLSVGQAVEVRDLCDEELEAVAGGAQGANVIGTIGTTWTTVFGPCREN